MMNTDRASQIEADSNTNMGTTGQTLLERLAQSRDTPAPSQRRRLSDPSAMGQLPPSLRPLPVRSMDGSRWLPTPDEQSRRVATADPAQSTPESQEESALTQHACSAAVCAVLKVFETTELLESILCFLDTKDVLSLRRTNRRWNSIVHTSPYLRLHFFTYTQWERPPSRYQLLPVNLSGITIQEEVPIELGQWVKVTMTPEAAKSICPEPKQRVRSRSIFEGMRGGLGSLNRSSNDAWPASTAPPPTSTGSLQYENLQISQPPILGMQAYVVHPNVLDDRFEARAVNSLLSGPLYAPSRDPPPIAKLSCDAGITLGFLAQTAQELLGSQVAGPSSHGEVFVVFKAIISFCDADSSPKKSTRRNLRTVTRIG